MDKTENTFEEMQTTDEKAKMIGDTLRRYFDLEGISQTQIAERLGGISQAAVSSRLSGKKPFGKNAADKWCAAFGFSRSFLIYGIGPLFPEKAKSVSQSIGENSGIAIQTAGDNSPVSTTEPTSGEGFFTRLCSQLMQQIVERDRRICCLEEENRQLRDKIK